MFPSSGEERETPTLLVPLERDNLNQWATRIEVKVFLRLTVGQSASSGIRPPSGTSDKFLASAVPLGSKSRRTRDHSLRLGSLSVASYDSQGDGGGIFKSLTMGM
jgi:hypothetical protein